MSIIETTGYSDNNFDNNSHKVYYSLPQNINELNRDYLIYCEGINIAVMNGGSTLCVKSETLLGQSLFNSYLNGQMGGNNPSEFTIVSNYLNSLTLTISALQKLIYYDLKKTNSDLNTNQDSIKTIIEKNKNKLQNNNYYKQYQEILKKISEYTKKRCDLLTDNNIKEYYNVSPEIMKDYFYKFYKNKFQNLDFTSNDKGIITGVNINNGADKFSANNFKGLNLKYYLLIVEYFKDSKKSLSDIAAEINKKNLCDILKESHMLIQYNSEKVPFGVKYYSVPYKTYMEIKNKK